MNESERSAAQPRVMPCKATLNKYPNLIESYMADNVDDRPGLQ